MVSRPRIIVASPLVVESNAVSDWLASDGFEPVRISSLERLTEEIRDRAFDALVVDRTLACKPGQQTIGAVRARNGKTPILVVGDQDAAAEAQVLSRGATYVARPLERLSFICMVSMAVMETRPERRSLRKRVNRLDAVVGGVPSHLIDISIEGLRLEMPRLRKATPPPPIFNVKVPLLGVALMARRMWACNLPGSHEAVWYGAELTGNTARVELAWRSLVDTIPAPGTALEVQ
jgi:AmiR/NasT family two-component response regulator